MRPLIAPLRRFGLQVLLLLSCYFTSRVFFTALNQQQFTGLSIGSFFRLAFHALRYDLSAIAMVNVPYILLLFLPLPTRKSPVWDKTTRLVFVVSNILALMFDISDWAYYPYNFKRSTADVLGMVTRQGDFWSVLPDYMISFWYVPLADALMICLLIVVNRKICRATPLDTGTEKLHFKQIAFSSLLLLVMLLGTGIAIRGGLQYIPIGMRNAVEVTDSRYVPIVVNTPFSIITTLASEGLEEVHYMPDSVAARLMPFSHHYQTGNGLTRKNVVIIILESESKEFTALGGGKSYTPFLDSLMACGLCCTQAFANGQTSAEGIPAIVAGIPTLMDEAFTTSNYGTNRITALPGVLGRAGYSSAFYHGGTNGTMSFDIFAAAAGFQHYYGRTEYANEKDYDGAWGIYDEPFLQYFAKGLGSLRQPFITTVFTLSAHPPFNLPENYKNSLPKGPLPIHQSITYTDIALRRFFETASRQPWFRNTLFVITADHCAPNPDQSPAPGGLASFAIPIIFYCPSDTALKGYFQEPVQQLDILPSVLQYLGWSQPFFAFGNSIFSRQEPRDVITHSSGNYQWLEKGHLLQVSADSVRGFYAFPADSLQQKNLLPSPFADSAATRLRAFIQQYRQTLIRNKME